ncbi:MAG: universal stress protein, partial [Pseudomonadota bacterium]|nr:universal stress protein [Pseudomonadota bacterium]
MTLRSAIIRPHTTSSRSRRELLDKRRLRFRILVCVDGSEASYDGVRFASRIAASDDCDIVLFCVRPIDQDMRTGGLQARVTRENMLDWGIELPGIRYLKEGLTILAGDESLTDHWTTTTSH